MKSWCAVLTKEGGLRIGYCGVGGGGEMPNVGSRSLGTKLGEAVS